MAKTYAFWALMRRNNRILTAAIGGSILYACAIAAAVPDMKDLSLGRGASGVEASADTGLRSISVSASHEAAGQTPRTVDRNLVNRPSNQT